MPSGELRIARKRSKAPFRLRHTTTLTALKGRLTDVLINGNPSEHYVYGSQNGNRIAANGVASAQIAYDSQDRLRQYGDYTYTYTNNGELRTKTHTPTSQVKTYTYDARGNLLSVATTGGTTISYVIDGMNRRVAKKRNDGTSTTVVAQWLYRDGLKPVADRVISFLPSCMHRIKTRPT